MAKHLYMDGVDDNLLTPVVNFTRVEMEVSIMAVQGTSTRTLYQTEGNTYFFSIQADGRTSLAQFHLINGVSVGSNNTYLQSRQGEKLTIIAPRDHINSQQTRRIQFASNYAGSNGTYVECAFFNIKIFNGTTLTAHYDMSTGTVQDQSGNGNHATLVGGTWMDDGTGGDPQGEDVTTTFALSQRLYKDTAEPYALKQSIFADRSAQHETIQRIYQDLSDTQPLRNILYADRTATYPMLQTFFQEGMIRSQNFAVKVQVYADKQQDFALRQELYEAISDHVALKQVMYKDETFNAELRQVISRQLSQNISTLQRMYDDKQADYPLLIQMLSDYKVYNQIVEREMFICRELTQDFAIVRTLEKEMRI